MSGVLLSVDLSSLDDVRASLRGASSGIEALRDHPGVVRGRAHDTGDAQLAGAVVGLANAWDWGLEVLAGELRRWDALLVAVSSIYRDTDRAVLASWR